MNPAVFSSLNTNVPGITINYLTPPPQFEQSPPLQSQSFPPDHQFHATWSQEDWNAYHQQQQYYYPPSTIIPSSESCAIDLKISSKDSNSPSFPPPSCAIPPPPPPQSNNHPPPPLPINIGKDYQEEMKKMESISKSHPADKIGEEDPQLRQQREEENRLKRLEAENKKKRKFPSSRQNAPQRFKKIELNAFKVTEDEEDPPRSLTSSHGDSSQQNPVQKNDSTMTKSLEDLSQSQREFISKTAEWVSKNEERFENLLQNSKDNEKLRFLNESSTAAGRYFLSELEKLKIQKSVREVCGGGSDNESESLATSQGHTHIQSGASQQILGSSISSLSREEIQRAGREAALIAMSLKRDLLASASTTAPTYLSHAPPPSIPPTTIVASENNERKRERRNRWGPTVSTPLDN